VVPEGTADPGKIRVATAGTLRQAVALALDANGSEEG
jgi:hypothetical protein